MGHARLPPLPMTSKWREVVALVGGGAGVAQVAPATLKACERGLGKPANDAGVVEAVWLLMRLPLAARGGDLVAELRRLGVDVAGEPDLPEVVAAVSETIDRRMPNNCRRTDLGEMAQMAAVETLTGHVGGRVRGLFDTGADEVQTELARLDTAKRFGAFAKEFFARLAVMVVGYFLDRTLSERTGKGQRFRTFRGERRFTDALDTHCREAAKILETYTGDWLKKHQWETQGDIERA